MAATDFFSFPDTSQSVTFTSSYSLSHHLPLHRLLFRNRKGKEGAGVAEDQDVKAGEAEGTGPGSSSNYLVPSSLSSPFTVPSIFPHHQPVQVQPQGSLI